MQNDSDKHYPLNDVIFNLQTSCTREEAVAIMLGMINGPPALIHKYAGYDYDTHEEIEDYGYSLQDDLEERRDSLISDYNEARIDKLPEEVVAKKLAAIKEFDTNYVNKARTYLCHIDDELTKGAKSELRLDQDIASGDPVRITLKSLDEWASKDEYKISIFKNLKSNTVSAMSPKDSQDEAEFDAKGRMTRKAADSLYTTFAFLLEAFVESVNGEKYGTKDKPNVSNIANHLCDLASAVNESENNGQGKESIKKRIKEARNRKRKFSENR